MNRTSILLLALLICGAFFLRIVLSLWSVTYLRENTDVIRYKDWARIAYLYGFGDTYTTKHLTFGTLANNQPPLTLYILTGTYYLQLQTVKVYNKVAHVPAGENPWINGPLVSFFIRLPAIVSDLLIGICIFLVIKMYSSHRKAFLGSAFFLFNPIVLYNSTIWGQIDSINNVCFVAALYFLSKRKLMLGLVLFTLSILIKLSLLFLVPFIVILILKQHYTKIKIIVGLGISTLLTFLLTLPVSTSPFQWLGLFVKNNVSGEMQNITAFAFNMWWTFFRPYLYSLSQTTLFSFSEVRLTYSPLVTTTFLHISLLTWAGLVFTMLIIPFIILLLRQKSPYIIQPKTFLLFAVIALVGFLVLPRMHERYMYPVFPLLAVGMVQKKVFWIVYILLSLCNLINVYFVWHPFSLFFISFSLLNNQIVEWTVSLVTCIVGLFFYIAVIKEYAK